MMSTKNQNSCKTQIYTCLCVDLLALSYGTSVGWISPTLNILNGPDSPLRSGPLTTDEISLIGSASCISGFISACIYGWIADRIGRKFALMTLGIPQLMGWALVYFAQNSYYLIASRFLHGFAGGGIFIVIPLFVTEISDDSIRGRLGSLIVLSSNSGILVAYVLCAYVNYYWNCICLFMITVFFFIGVYFIQESPIYLLKRNRRKDAEHAIRFYKSSLRYGDMETRQKVKLECEKLTSLVNCVDSDIDSKIRAADFLTKAAIRSIIIGIALMTFSMLSGTFALLSYASLILSQSGSTLSPNTSAVIVAFIQVFGVYISTFLSDRAGRKVLLITSATFCTIGLSIFSSYDYLKNIGYDVEDFNLVPLICFAFVLFSANFGITPLPFVVLPEITPMKIKSTVYSFSLAYSWVIAFLTAIFLPTSVDAIGVYGTVGIFAINCFIGIIFIGFFVPETKNRSIEEIQKIMSK